MHCEIACRIVNAGYMGSLENRFSLNISPHLASCIPSCANQRDEPQAVCAAHRAVGMSSSFMAADAPGHYQGESIQDFAE